MTRIIIDFETRSALDIKKVGAWKYAAHPSTEILCLGYSYEGHSRLLTAEDLARDKAFPVTDAILVAHNAHFEYAIYHEILVKRFNWPEMRDPKRWDCTLARSVACGLPASLENVGRALNLKVQKDLTGRAALLKLCKPLPSNNGLKFNEDRALKQQLYAYCLKDVEAEVLLDNRLPKLSAKEHEIWELDLEINARGVKVDTQIAEKASVLAETLSKKLNSELVTLTNGAVDSATRVTALKRWLETQGVNGVESLNKPALSALLADNTIPSNVKTVLNIRRQVGKSSTAKYQAAINTAGADSRVRGALQYHAAHTGRWGGRLIQPQNYPKGLNLKAQDQALEFIRIGDPDMFRWIYGDQAMDTLSGALRGTITCEEGNELIVADYSAIEARGVLWLADDTSALEKFRKGINLYVDMARYIFENPAIEDASHPSEYAIGKATILGCGYGMGPVRFYDTCKSAGVKLSEDLAQTAVQAYRTKYRSVVNLWYDVERAAINAVKNPGPVYHCAGKKIAFGMDSKREFLVCRLPSGRFIRYFLPKIKSVATPRGEKEELSYMAPNLAGDMEEVKTYGGALVENVTQAIARDIMADAMLRCARAGIKLVLTVHDELVAEMKKGVLSLEEFIKILCVVPEWATGFPVAAKGWVGQRYHK